MPRGQMEMRDKKDIKMTNNILFQSALVALCTAGWLCAQGNSSQPEVSPAVKHDVSPPLRGIPAAPHHTDLPPDRPLRPVPANVLENNARDPVVQSSAPLPFVGTTAGLNFAGVGTGDYGFVPNAAPPDTNGAVGATQYVQWVNESFAVFDKTNGALIKTPTTGNTLWAGFGG